MRDWIKEIIEQICIGEILRDSTLDSGNRLALIAVDNCVEFALKFYASYNRILNPKELNSNDAFYKVIDYITPSLITNVQAKDLKQFHEHRNTLYHGAKLTTVNSTLVTRYVALARDLISVLYQYPITTQSWSVLLNGARKSILGRQQLAEPVIYEKQSIDGRNLVRMVINSQPKHTEDIELVIHGFLVSYARHPTNEELDKSMKISGRSMTIQRLRVSVAQLRGQHKIEKDSLSLTPSGVLQLRRKFLI